MELLGIEVPPALAGYYGEVEAHLRAKGYALTCEWMEGPEFGGFYLSEGAATVGVRSDLPPLAVCHTIAHELAHGLQRLDGWPRVVANPALEGDAAAKDVAAVLQAVVHCAAAEARIDALGLDPSWEQMDRHQNIRALLRAPQADANHRGTPAWGYWAMLYAYITLLHPAAQSRALLHNIRRAIPEAAAAGTESAALVREHGFQTPEQALASLRAVQEALGLAPGLLVEDPRDGTVYGGAAVTRVAPQAVEREGEQ
jgi:hypothetical protein